VEREDANLIKLIAMSATLFVSCAIAAEAKCLSVNLSDATVSGKILSIRNGNWPKRKNFHLSGCGSLEIVIDEPPATCSKGRQMKATGGYVTCDEYDIEDGTCRGDEPDSVMVNTVHCY
jgi:hypothetical protein